MLLPIGSFLFGQFGAGRNHEATWDLSLVCGA